MCAAKRALRGLGEIFGSGRRFPPVGAPHNKAAEVGAKCLCVPRPRWVGHGDSGGRAGNGSSGCCPGRLRAALVVLGLPGGGGGRGSPGPGGAALGVQGCSGDLSCPGGVRAPLESWGCPRGLRAALGVLGLPLGDERSPGDPSAPKPAGGGVAFGCCPLISALSTPVVTALSTPVVTGGTQPGAARSRPLAAVSPGCGGATGSLSGTSGLGEAPGRGKEPDPGEKGCGGGSTGTPPGRGLAAAGAQGGAGPVQP